MPLGTFGSLMPSPYLPHWRMAIRCLVSVYLSVLFMAMEVFCSLFPVHPRYVRAKSLEPHALMEEIHICNECCIFAVIF